MKLSGLKLKVSAIVLVGLSLIHCGRNNNNNNNPVGCDANQLSTAMGCLPTCGTNMVWNNNQCVSATGLTSGLGINGNGGIVGIGLGGQGNLCSGTCGNGAVLMTDGRTCLPQGTCGPCYGYAAGYCYIGMYAHQYYGQ